MIFSLWTAGTLRADEQTPSQIRGFTPSTSPPLGCSGQSSLPEDGVEVELELMARKALGTAMSRDRRTGGPTPAPFAEAAMAGYGASRPFPCAPAKVR